MDPKSSRILALAATAMLSAPAAADDGACAWRSLFNGENLDGWLPKIRGFAAGEDPYRTFRVVDGLLTVAYDGYEGPFEDRFGHLFFLESLSRYRLRLDYRFTGEQVPGGPEWAWRNSGVMLHAPPPIVMPPEQDFPVSAEAQLLGGRGDGSVRHTGNLCTPGIHVAIDGVLDTRHCIESDSPTFDGDEWVHLELEVLGGQRVTHYINGAVVMRYGNLVREGPDGGVGAPVTEGYFALQAESHPVQFRDIALLDLEDCPSAVAPSDG